MLLQPQLHDVARVLQNVRRVLHRTALQPEVIYGQQFVARLDGPRAVGDGAGFDVRDEEGVVALTMLRC